MSDFSLEQLLEKLGPEENVEIDWNAPEAGQFPPIARPGTYDFVFRLREDTPFDTIEIQGRNYLSIVFDADVIVNGETKALTYQRVNTYKHEKVALSSASELARSLRLENTLSTTPTNRDWVAAFQAASGRARGRAKLEWRFYDKETDVTYSTAPRKRKNKAGVKVKDQPWPRKGDGSFEDAVTGSDSQKHFGQAEFVNFFRPAAADAVSGD